MPSAASSLAVRQKQQYSTSESMRARGVGIFIVVAAVLFAPSVARAFQRVDGRSMAPGGRWATSSEAPTPKAELPHLQRETLATVHTALQPPAPKTSKPEPTSVEPAAPLDSPFDASPDPLRGPPSL
jgi:hypothetical protein